MSNPATVEVPLAKARTPRLFLRSVRVAACVFLGSSVLILFPGSTSESVADTLPKGLPKWFRELDNNRDGQISLHEWRKSGKKLGEFRNFDLNADGLLTPQEILQVIQRPVEMKLINGQATYNGVLEAGDAKHLGQKIAKIVTVRLEADKTYQIDHMSRAFDAYLFLEEEDGTILAQDDDGGGNLNSRIVHRAAKTGTYRLVATSLGGGGLGPFSLSVRDVAAGRLVPPPWFKELDTDQDGQVSLQEWRKGGRKAAAFRELDRNGDGFLTPEEVIPDANRGTHLRFDENGRANYDGTIETAKDDEYQGKKAFKILTVRLRRGRTYQIDMTSQAYVAWLYLEDLDGETLEISSRAGNGRVARIVHRAEWSGTYRLVATSQAGVRTGPFSLSVSAVDDAVDIYPKGLPPWFKELDADRDGQLSLPEWRKGRKSLAEFRQHDQNGDGFLTAAEVLGDVNKVPHLRFEKGRANYNGQVFEEPVDRYHGKKSFKVLTVRLNAGRTYHLEMVSPAYFSYLYLEDPDGEIVGRHDSGGNNRPARIVHEAETTGTYRIIATSQAGVRTGPFTLSVREGSRAGGAAVEDLPPPFKALDRDNDGQISLAEWRAGGKKLDEFRNFDLNGDGFLTAAEVLQVVRRPLALKVQNGEANYNGALEAGDVRFQGRKIAKIFSVTLESGRTYQFDHKSRAFDAYLYLQDADGSILDQNDDGGGGTNSRIVYRATRSGAYRLVATSLGGGGLGPFSVSVRAVPGPGGAVPSSLPPWFKSLDTDKDGQVSLQEWRAAGKKLDEFATYDLNADGLLTPEEVIQVIRRPIELKLVNGRASYSGVLQEGDLRHLGRKIAKVFAVKLEAGRTYQIDHRSRAFDAYLYLEDADGGILAQDDDSGGNLNSRIVHRATRSGTYRLVATSLGGENLGPFALSVTALDAPGGEKKKGQITLPPWFKEIDTDKDGQISLREWRQSGKGLAEFRAYDLNEDGFLTEPEVLRYLKLQEDQPWYIQPTR